MHWFWNSTLMDRLEKWLVTLTNYIWNKRRTYEKQLANSIKRK
jgi:hypothetical protein